MTAGLMQTILLQCQTDQIQIVQKSTVTKTQKFCHMVSSTP